MKSVKFKQANTEIAKDQKEYATMYAHAQANGLVTCCMELDNTEVHKIRVNRNFAIAVLNFNRPVHPITVHAKEPQFPIDFRVLMNVNPEAWNTEKGYAVFLFDNLPESMIKEIKRTKKLWITTATYGKPMQPISGQLLWGQLKKK